MVFKDHMKSVAIIGGGITGLTAAFNLQQRGIPVTLYEASDRVGGVIRTVLEDGYLAECGPNTILETSPVIGQLIRDVNLEARRLYSDPTAEKRYLVRNKKTASELLNEKLDSRHQMGYCPFTGFLSAGRITILK